MLCNEAEESSLICGFPYFEYIRNLLLMLCNQMRIVVIRRSLKRSLSDVKRLDKDIKKKAYYDALACLEYRFLLQLPINWQERVT